MNIRSVSRLFIVGGNSKTLFGQLFARHLIYLARENRYWAKLTLCLISALPCQINQISDGSRPNNCGPIIFLLTSEIIFHS